MINIISVIHEDLARRSIQFQDFSDLLTTELTFISLLLFGLGVLTSKFNQKIVRILSVIFVFGLFLYSLASWIHFHFIGSFLNLDGLKFIWINFGSLQKHFISTSIPLTMMAYLSLFLFPILFYKSINFLSRKAPLIFPISFFSFFVLSLAAGFHSFDHHTLSRNVLKDRTELSKKIAREFGPFSAKFLDLLNSKKAFANSRVLWGEDSKDLSVVWSPITPYNPPVQPLKKKNVVLFLIESLRPDQLETFGGKLSVMPALDKLAAEGIRFKNFYANSSHSDYADIAPVSSAFPLRTTTHYFYPLEYTYPKFLIWDLLKPLGYRTAIFSSQNEDWGQMANFLISPNLDRFFHSGNSNETTYINENDQGFRRWAEKTGKLSGKLDDSVTTRYAREYIKKIPDDEPFFLLMNYQSSHAPYTFPETYKRKFGPQNETLNFRFRHYPLEILDKIKLRYSDSLSYIDLQIAKILEELESSKRLDDTILIFAGDQGEAFGENGIFSHAGQLYEAVVRVPVVIWSKDLQSKEIDGICQSIDIPPMILSLIGAPPFSGLQGEDCLQNSPPPRPVFLTAQTNIIYQYGVVFDGMKLLYSEQSRRMELFNLRLDPQESRNLAQILPQDRIRLKAILDEWYTTQLDYYSNIKKQKTYFPPKYKINTEVR